MSKKIFSQKLFCLIFIFSIFGCGSENEKIIPQTGPQGKPGADAKITSSVKCASSELISGKTYIYGYQAIEFSTGVKFVACSVGVGTQSSGNIYYPVGAPGAGNSECDVRYSIPGNTAGNWHFFNSMFGKISLEYRDPGEPTDAHVYFFAPGECQ